MSVETEPQDEPSVVEDPAPPAEPAPPVIEDPAPPADEPAPVVAVVERWESCRFEDLRLGDRVRCQWINRGRLHTREGVVAGFSTLVATDPAGTTDAALDEDGRLLANRRDAGVCDVLTRIPAPPTPVEYTVLPAVFGSLLTDVRDTQGRDHGEAVWSGFHWCCQSGATLDPAEIDTATHEDRRLTRDGATDIGQPRFRKEPHA